MVCSIFMASKTTRGLPPKTVLPVSTSTLTILPFMGAVSPPWGVWLASASEIGLTLVTFLSRPPQDTYNAFPLRIATVDCRTLSRSNTRWFPVMRL
ncbi:hypothetical protein D3C75_1197260 [compost metagenome]